MRLAYFDCFSGLSGDMALAALIHAGADFDSIAEVLHSFPSDDFSLQGEEVEVRGLSALRIHIESGPQGVIRTYANIRALLEEADLPGEVRRMAHLMYHRLANAAAKVHGKDPELVTFVEFGELDCLVEFVGCRPGDSKASMQRARSKGESIWPPERTSFNSPVEWLRCGRGQSKPG